MTSTTIADTFGISRGHVARRLAAPREGHPVMTIIDTRLSELLNGGILAKSSHPSFEDGACAMEWVAYLAGEGHTDAPECASPVLRSFCISLNDQWDAVNRQRLVPFLPRMVGTAGDGQEEARSFLALDWLIRTYTPAWLDLAGLAVEAQALRDLRRIVDLVSAQAAGPVVRAGRAAARAAAWAAARAAAWAAAWAAARAAAWAAAWAAAGDAARDAAGDAAGDAARAAARSAAGDAAGAAAGDAAWAAAGDAAWAAAGAAAWAAAGDAARDALKPTAEILQASALDLLDRMIDPSVVTA
jgi:hypothetical protein